MSVGFEKIIQIYLLNVLVMMANVSIASSRTGKDITHTHAHTKQKNCRKTRTIETQKSKKGNTISLDVVVS